MPSHALSCTVAAQPPPPNSLTLAKQPRRAAALRPLPPKGISRPELGRRVLGDPAALEALETVVHALVIAAQAAFLARAAAAGQLLVVRLRAGGPAAGCR